MVHFVIYEDVLQYKVKINQLINKLDNINYEIHDETYKINFKESDAYIFIIDLEKENATEYIRKINSNYNSNFFILILTNQMNLAYHLLARELMIFDILHKFDNFEKKLQEDINFIINKVFKKKLSISDYKVKIPKDEIEQITILKDKIIIKCINIKNEGYTYIIDDKYNKIKNDIKKHFIYNNDNCTLYFKRNEFHLNVNLKISKNNKYVKPYNNETKEEILSLYNKGYKVSELSRKHAISKTTIYNWIKISKMNIKIRKYEKIEKIVNS